MAEPNQTEIPKMIQKIYTLYNDYVLKNPFYELDQPIKSEKFDINLEKLLTSKN